MHAYSQPFSLHPNLHLKNRIVLAPMTNSQSQEDGTLGDDEYQWLMQHAEGGFGLIITCATYISKTSKAWKGQLGLYDDKQIPALQRLTRDIKQYNSACIMQIFHGGVRCPSAMTGQQPVSASEYVLDFPGFEKPRALIQAEIQTIVTQFADAAERAYKAGFSGIELHGANGYLITQFISTQTNLRTDEYGGSLANRARFVREIMRACKQRVPASFLVGCRLSPEGIGLDIDENLQIAEWLKQDGADYIHLSLGDVFAAPKKYAPTSDKPLTQYFREKLGNDFPVIAGGGIKTPADANKALQTGTDLVYLARTAIGNTQWPNLAAKDANYTPVAPPYTADYLKQTGISDSFMGYLQTMPKGFALV
jgi:2,4-dienoyl-CoA reductase-like NADH-dependent reductase (Old Yellow Enzyme family)